MNLVNVAKEIFNLIVLIVFGLILLPIVLYWMIEDKIKGIEFSQ